MITSDEEKEFKNCAGTKYIICFFPLIIISLNVA